MGRGNQLVGNLHVMGRQTAQHWHIPLGGIFIQLYNANFCRWLGGVFHPGKRDQVWHQGLDQTWTGKYCWWTTIGDQTQAAATWLPRVDFEVGCTFSTPGETGETSPLPHARNTAGGTLPVLGDVHIHCTKACSPCDPALPPRDGGPFPDLSRGGFPTGGVWVVRSHAGHFGGCVTVRWWGKESLAGSMVRKSQPAALLLHLLPVQLLVAQQPVLFQGPHPSPWGWLMAAREVTAMLPCTGRSYSRGERGRREVGSMRVSQECFSITGTHFCSSQRCWKASYVTCCEGLGHSWSGICKQNQQFSLKKRQVVSHASSPLAYFRLPDLSAPWCCLCHC